MQARAFGRYEIVQRISMGGMAEVFLARHTPTGTLVALKRILPEISEDEEFIKMFEDEARIASRLEHPYIARCLDFGHVSGDWFIAFEYVAGKDLRALLDRCTRQGQHPPLWFVCYVFSRIAEGLAYAHARKDEGGAPVSIVHRDVSPQNIVVSFDGDVKLIDFGIAKAAGKLSRTQVGSIKGKFGYMSPEQVKGVEVDARADLFSMGICMWELLTLQRLFNAQNELLVIEKVRSLRVEPPSRYNPEVPAALDQVVLKCLAKDPDERYRAAKDIYRDLNHVAAGLGLASREQIAQYMRRAFPDAPGQGSVGSGHGNVNSSSARQVREMGNMATHNDKSSSDLDIFEGLGKKGASARPAPPPPSSRATPPPPPGRLGGDPMKRTLLGVTAPSTMPSAGGGAPVPPPGMGPGSRTPPPPPGRASLPPVVAPPPRSSAAPPPPSRVSSHGPPPAAAPISANMSAAATAPNPTPVVDMDWDDEDEATHIFDKADDGPPVAKNAAPIPAAGTPPPPSLAKNKATLLGLTAPMQAPPPPPSMSQPAPRPTPPPPPPASNAFARASGGPASFPPPPTINPIPPPPQTQQGMGPNPFMTSPSAAPPPASMRNPLMGVLPPAPLPAPMPVPMGRPLSVPEYQPPPRAMEATALVRPQQSRTGLWVALGLVGIAAVGVAVFLLMPHTGRIAVNVNDANAKSGSGSINRVDIFVDGRKTPCETAPCIVDQVSAGSHEVKVLAEGYDTPPSQSVNVESGKDVNATFALSSATKVAGIKASGSQAGVKLYVDDKEIGPLPQEIRDLTPGDHTIKIAGSERYQPLEKHVTVTKDSIEDLGNIQLKVLKGKATISLGTPGARVYLVSGSDRRELPMLPISVDIDTAKSWALQATKTGYTDYNQSIAFDDGQAEKSYTVTLDPKTAAVSAPVYSPSPAAPAPAPAPAAPAPRDNGGDETSSEAFLNINSIPPSTCFLDGRSLGSTPKVHVSVKPGAHTVKFVNSDQGLSKTISVRVGAGETKPAVAKLE
ncbi:MAG TPA: serine/threonine-protein kinase [Polyangiaceae bacterium]|jgi:serine/threonine-protein kinase